MRADLLDKVGSLILERKDALGKLLASEEGKTLPEATGETVRAGRIFKYFAGEALRRHGQNLESVRPGVEIQTYREAVGVYGLITPWNFPIAIPAWKIAPALAFGNTVVLKPANPTPATAHALASIIHEAGAPAGVFNMVLGRGIVGDALSKHPDVNGISFTGSQTVGAKVAQAAVSHHGAGAAGNGRQESAAGAGRCRIRPRRADRGGWRLFRHRPALHRLQPRVRAGRHL